MTAPTTQQRLDILRQAKTIAVVGASPNEARPSNWISAYLMSLGFRVIPVNPGHSELFGLPCFPDLAAISEPVDVVNIYRRSDQVMPIIEQALERPELQLIWMQDNVYNPEAEALARAAGVPCVMNDCIFRFLRHQSL